MIARGICTRLAALLALLMLAGCGSSSGPSTGASGSVSQPSSATTTASSTSNGPTATSGLASGGAVHVNIKGLAFHPGSIDVKVGDAVVFLNEDTVAHDVRWAAGPKFASSSQLSTGAKFTLTVHQVGTIHYYCSIHPFMKGTILVTK